MLKRRTCHELLILLGHDLSPHAMGVQSTVLTTALDQLSPEAKADIVQHLTVSSGKPRPCGACGDATNTCVCAIDR
jgi:hypothetical protein